MKKFVSFIVFLLIKSSLSAQNPMTDNLQAQFQTFQSGAPQEKLFVHIDKTFYLAGETVWFKVYAVDASFHRPISASSIAYIEIINKDLKPVIQTKVSMLNGSGNGSFVLPASLISGNYVFRAYTSWMKNFPPEFYYQQSIHIVNTLRPSTITTPQKLPSTIQFFPEGGQAVVGFSEKFAFKATDGNDLGINCNGAIINQNNDTILTFRSSHNGMGNFLLHPEKNMNYYAVLRLNDSLIKQKLPEAEEQGFVMNISEETTDGQLRVIVHATPDLNNSTIYLFVQTRQIVKNIQSNTIKNGEALFLIDKKMLGDGISGITLFNSSRQPVCERLVFKRPLETLLINAKADQAVYNTRSPVNIDLSTINLNNQPLKGNLSLSVFMIDSLQPVQEQDIVSYLFLNSELRGKIESPEFYFSNIAKDTDEAIDNLLLTQGWRRFKWNDVLNNKKPAFEFLPEIEGPVLNGKIVNKITGSPAGSTDAFLSVPGYDYAFCSATSNDQGLVHFAFKNIYNNNAVVLQPSLQKDSNYRIDMSNSYSDKYYSFPDYSLVLSKKEENILLSRSIGNQVENTYLIDKKHQYRARIIDTTSFYGIPDRFYNLDDFTRFQTMEEVLREYVEDVRVRKDGNKFNFKVRNRLFSTYFEEDPLILLDGIPVSDASKIIALDPLKIKRIELVTRNYYTGSSSFAGIVNVKSYTGEMGATVIDPNSLVVEFDGIQQQREFYAPKYETREEQENHIPDFRNVLYWAPQISTGINGKTHLLFYSSDVKGKFAVVVEGISENGLPGKALTIFDVTDSR